MLRCFGLRRFMGLGLIGVYKDVTCVIRNIWVSIHFKSIFGRLIINEASRDPYALCLEIFQTGPHTPNRCRWCFLLGIRVQSGRSSHVVSGIIGFCHAYRLALAEFSDWHGWPTAHEVHV